MFISLVSDSTNIEVGKGLFNKKNITGLLFSSGAIGFTTIKPYWRAVVTFEQDSIKAEKKFEVQGLDNFPLLLKEVNDFIESL